MNRIFEELRLSCVYAPQAVPTATLKTTDFVDVSNLPEVEFHLAIGALEAGKKVTVELHASAVAAGTNAVKVASTVFTADAAQTSAVAALSYKVKTDFGRYVGVKFKHDAGADVLCCVTAAARARELPPGNGWTLGG